MSGIFTKRSPKVRGPVSLRAVREKLEEYVAMDPTPRVKNVTAVVLANLEKIFDDFTP